MNISRFYRLFCFLLSISPCFQLFSQFENRNIELLDLWTQESLKVNSSKARYNDCWGFVFNKSEYAVAGSTEGTHVFAIKNQKLIQAGFVAGDFSSSLVVHRDFKTYKNYLYSVCDEGPSGLQIISLDYLPDSLHLLKTIAAPFGRVHNIYIDTTAAVLYAFIVTQIENGMPTTKVAMRVFDISDPENPVLKHTLANNPAEVHDGYVRNGKAILNCGFDGLRVYDFSNPSNPIFKQSIDLYLDQGYNHQGWLSPNGETYIFGDETEGKKLKLCKKNASGEWEIKRYFGTDTDKKSVPHNITIDDHYIYVSYYNSGFRVYKYENTIVSEVAYFDTYPDESLYKLNGAWGVFTDFPSGNILVSDRQYGLFLLGFNRSDFLNEISNQHTLFPNPCFTNSEQTFRLNTYFDNPISVLITDYLGHSILEFEAYNKHVVKFLSPPIAGVYIVTITYNDIAGNKVTIKERVVYY